MFKERVGLKFIRNLRQSKNSQTPTITPDSTKNPGLSGLIQDAW